MNYLFSLDYVLRFFQLKDIYIAESVISNWIKKLLESELALKEEYIQEAQIVRKSTDQMVKYWSIYHSLPSNSKSTSVSVFTIERP